MNRNRLLKPGLITHSLLPANQESPIHFLRDRITPDHLIYRRNHFRYPVLSKNAFLLPVTGEVLKPAAFSYEQLKSMPARTVVVPMECAGNRRAAFEPKVFGEQWRNGAVSQSVWKGVPLAGLLSFTGLTQSAREIVCTGYDVGMRTDSNKFVSYARSLPIAKALHADTIVAYEMNGNAIPLRHGFPMRLIVPQWYGMSSVKWLRSVQVIDHEFNGPFQTTDYNYYPDKSSDEGKQPVTVMNVNSIIQQPMDQAVLNTGIHYIEGVAWTGVGHITSVEISTDGGERWEPSLTWQRDDQPYGWSYWSYTWRALQPGEYKILSRARDSAGRVQPMQAMWNRKGYGFNAVYRIELKVE